jgi:oxygen-dependent protoporphyrinogen oxidase
MHVAVVGGGISGLAAAWRLGAALPGADVVVYEGAPDVGGKLRLGSVAGIPVDVGAEAMLARRPEGLTLAREAGLADAVVAPLTTAAAIRAGGAVHPMPARTMLGIPADAAAVRASGVLSEAALRRIVAEPSGPPLPPLTADTAVGTLVRDRLGNEVVDRLVDPLLGGVYAGRADELSLRATMPALAAHLAGGGSLVAAAAAVADTGTRAPSGEPVFASLAGGLGTLPRALVSSGRFRVRTSATVRSITRTADGFRLVVGAVPVAEAVDADAVVVVPDSMSSSVSCALWRLAFASARSTSADVGSIRASSWPSVTCSPAFTYTLVTLPEAPKLRFMVLAGDRLPLPDTVDCTTPLETVTIRSLVVDDAFSGPTTTIAATTPPTATAPSATLIGVSSERARDGRGIRAPACGRPVRGR